MKRQTIFAVIFILFLAGFLRFYRIDSLTEFLGDQGRTGLVIYDAWVNKSIPVAGPTVLTGQHLGPFFYYLMAPSFILSNFNPLAPALFTAFLGVLTVLLMFYIGTKLFGFWIGLLIATLYAVSPSIVTSDRIIWEPNVIPFFILLFIVSLYKIREESNFKYFALLGITLGALVQLHYPNIFLVLLASLFWLLIVIRKRKTPSLKLFLSWTIAAVLGFLFILFPFILFEAQHNLIDLKEITLIFLSSSRLTEPSAPSYLNFLDYSSRLFKNLIPLQQSWYFSLLQLLIVTFPFIRRNFWHAFFTFWFVSGLFGMSLYKGVVYDHYLMFILPIPFFLFGFLIKTMTQELSTFVIASVAKQSHKIATPFRLAMTISVLTLIILSLTKSDIFSKGNNDLLRTESMTNEIISQSNNQTFSFTLISSRSFSDLHYRYYFKLKNIKPQNITSKNYNFLFLVCEKSPCPTKEEFKKTSEVQVLCYDPHCEGEYPKIDLRNFTFINSKDIFDGRIFTFKRI